ncbi:MAG: Holliday junction resolvase RuvX [Clostridia bacterium]|nr:Holliday junction resolvase RuvX [Clostridia bacterium]
MKRILGIDYGDARTGFAVSDPMQIIANAVGTLSERNADRVIDEIEKRALEFDVERIVLGYPKNMNNTIGERAKKTEEFAERLRTRLPDVPVILWDERGTTKSAIYVLNEANVRNKKRKKAVDTVAAVIILQSYLDFAGGTRPAET